MATKSIESELVRSLAQLLDESNLTEIEYDTGAVRIRVARQGVPVQYQAPVAMAAPVAAAAAAAAPALDDASTHPGAVPSPMVGVAYLSPEPSAPKFIEVGQTVSEGQTLMLIEAMKTFNPIRAPKGGKLTRILVSDGQPVEFAQPLVIIE